MLPMKTALPAQALRLVPYLSPQEVRRLTAGCRGRHRERAAPLSALKAAGYDSYLKPRPLLLLLRLVTTHP